LIVNIHLHAKMKSDDLFKSYKQIKESTLGSAVAWCLGILGTAALLLA